MEALAVVARSSASLSSPVLEAAVSSCARWDRIAHPWGFACPTRLPSKSQSAGPVPRLWRGVDDDDRWRRGVRLQLQIDRRRHFEGSLQRQEAEEAREAEAEITCPVDCVREVRTYAEFERVLQDAELTNNLVVVDFYDSSCGSCKYVLPQFIKLCKQGCGEECSVEEGKKGIQFIKHNVRDDYDDLTDLARFYGIRTVPMFSFFVDGCRIEQFPTRHRDKLEQSIQNMMRRVLS